MTKQTTRIWQIHNLGFSIWQLHHWGYFLNWLYAILSHLLALSLWSSLPLCYIWNHYFHFSGTLYTQGSHHSFTWERNSRVVQQSKFRISNNSSTASALLSKLSRVCSLCCSWTVWFGMGWVWRRLSIQLWNEDSLWKETCSSLLRYGKLSDN